MQLLSSTVDPVLSKNDRDDVCRLQRLNSFRLSAYPGGVNASGGHTYKTNDEYHCHRDVFGFVDQNKLLQESL
ncbi:hypothetical protein IMCC21906_00978 [Spongiibacter sp. IMCC21906]|nr:hypothetical protein IMCC21906_00978 [Spongiibacter sp. IMCC21906]